MKKNTTFRQKMTLLFISFILFTLTGFSQTVLLTESWESASIGQTPPAGWAVDLVSGSNYIQFLQNGTHPTCTPANGSRMVEFQSYNASSGTSNRLKRTAAISTIGYVYVTVDFKWLRSNGYPNSADQVSLQWSTNGTTWTTASTINRYSSIFTWEYEAVALPAGAANQTTLYIAFLFTSAHGENCHLDFVHVNGFLTVPPPPSVTTLPPSYVASKTAYLAGTVNANGNQTNTSFQYGLTTSYGYTASAGTVSGNTPVSIMAGVNNLIPGRLYHCRAVGINVVDTTYGNDIIFNTNDTLAEVFTYYANNIGGTTATVNGRVYPNGAATTITFDYGLTPAYGSTIAAIPPTISGDSLYTWAYANLAGLTPNTTYHYRITGVNASGTSHGYDSVFTTSGNQAPTVITNSATSITANGATLNGQVNANGAATTVTFQYGLTPSYGSTVNYGTVNGNSMTPVSKAITGLSPLTTYHFRIVGVNANGTSYGADSVFTTLSSTIIPPSVVTTHATMINAGNAVLNGTANANGSSTAVSFQYGITASYGNTVNAWNINGNYVAPVSVQVFNLVPATLYHYRIVGTNAGGTSYGLDTTFTTLDSIPWAVTYPAFNVASTSATLHGAVNPYGSAATVTFEFGMTPSLGMTISGDPPNVSGNYGHAVNGYASGLIPNTIYYYRIKAVNAMGINYGEILTFFTETGPGCDAIMTYEVTSGLTVEFLDVSTGGSHTRQWYFGDGENSELPDPVHTYPSPGDYLVRLIITGDSLPYCIDSSLQIIHLADTIIPCQAQFTWYPDPVNPNILHFTDLSTGTIAHRLWNFDDDSSSTATNPTHTFSLPGVYYVCLAIDGPDCLNTNCQEITVGNPSNCTSYFLHSLAGQTATFAGYLTGGQPATYNWSFGDGQFAQGQVQVHTYSSPGVYYVTLNTIDSANCIYSSGQILLIGDSVQYNQVYGQVFADGDPISSGVVNLISVDTVAPYLPFLAITAIDTGGTYYFPMVPEGDYYIYAIPVGVAGYMPTFYGDVLFWEEATIVHLGEPSNPYDINLAGALPLYPGNGTIGGQINTGDLKSTFIEQVAMLLMNDVGSAVGHTHVNPDGSFGFEGLGYGIYYLKAELAGIISDVIRVELNATVPNADVVMTFTGNRILGLQEGMPSIGSFTVFPVPASDRITASFESVKDQTIRTGIFDMTGSLILSREIEAEAGPNLFHIQTADLPNGIYMMKIFFTEGKNITRKIVIIR
jgi:PKD repeat protein